MAKGLPEWAVLEGAPPPAPQEAPTPLDEVMAQINAHTQSLLTPAVKAAPSLDLPVMEDGRVPVAFRDGSHGTIEARDAEQHIKLGGSFLKPEQYAQERLQSELDKAHKEKRSADKKEANKWTATDALAALTNPLFAPIKALAGGEQAQAYEQGFIRGGTLGLSDAAILGLNTGDGHVPGLVEAIKGPGAEKAAREYMNIVDKENSGFSGAGEFVGTVSSILATSGLGGTAAATESALAGLERKTAEMGAKYGLEALGQGVGKVGANVVRGAPLNAAFGAGHEISKAALDNDELMAEHVAAGALNGLLAGAAIDVGLGAGGAALGAARKAVSPLVSKLVGAGESKIALSHKVAMQKALGMGAEDAAALGKELGPAGEDAFWRKADKVLREKPTAKIGDIYASVGDEVGVSGKRIGQAALAADEAGITVSARDIERAAKAATSAASPAEAAATQAAVDGLIEKSGLRAAREDLAAKYATEAESAIKQKYEPLFTEIADADLKRIELQAKDLELTQEIQARKSGDFGDAAPANNNGISLEKQRARVRSDLRDVNKIYGAKHAEGQALLAPIKEEAAVRALADADVALPFSQARAVKDTLKDGIGWHAMPDPLKKAWQGIENHIEGIADKAGAQIFGESGYKGIKAEHAINKELHRRLGTQAKAALERGSVLDQALSNMAMGGAFGSAKGAVTAGAIGAAKAIGKEYGPRLMVNMLGHAAETQALSKLVGYTDLAIQGAVSGAGTGAKAALLTATEPKGRRELFQHRVEQLEKYKSDPDAFLASIDKQLDGLSPNKRQAILLQADKTLQFLSGKIPPSATSRQDPLAPQVKLPVRTSDAEIRRFLAQFDTAMDPTTAYGAMRDGRLRQDQVDTVKAVYPNLDQRAQFVLGTQIVNATERPAGKVRQGITKVMGMPSPTSATPDYAARIRATYGPLIPGGSAEHRQAPSTTANRPAMSFQKNTNQRMTVSQGLELGEK